VFFASRKVCIYKPPLRQSKFGDLEPKNPIIEPTIQYFAILVIYSSFYGYTMYSICIVAKVMKKIWNPLPLLPNYIEKKLHAVYPMLYKTEKN